MSETPETDKAEDRERDPMMYDDWAWIVPANFARRLERERDEARRELARVRKELVAANRGAERNSKVNQGLCSKLAIAELERDEALEELNVWRELNVLIAKLKEEA